MADHPDIFEEVRGQGLMLGLRCKPEVAQVVSAAFDQELILVPAGENVARLLPPLNITQEDIAEAITRLDRAATALEST